VDGHYSHVTIEFMEYCVAHQILPYCLPPHSTHPLQPLDVGLFGPLQHYYSSAVDKAIRHGIHGIYKGNFLPLYLEARQQTYYKDNIQGAFKSCGMILPLNARIILNKLPQQVKSPHGPNVSDILGEPATPKNSGDITRLMRQTKLQIAKENNPTVREVLLTSLVDRLARFGIARDADHKLVEQSFEQWREANNLNTRVDGWHLGRKKQNLARVLDGEEIARLYDERVKKDLAKKEKKAKGGKTGARTTSQVISTPPPPRQKRTYKHTRFVTPSPPLSELDNEEVGSSDDSILSTTTVHTPAPPTPFQGALPPPSTPCPPRPPRRCISRGPIPVSPAQRVRRPRK